MESIPHPRVRVPKNSTLPGLSSTHTDARHAEGLLEVCALKDPLSEQQNERSYRKEVFL